MLRFVLPDGAFVAISPSFLSTVVAAVVIAHARASPAPPTPSARPTGRAGVALRWHHGLPTRPRLVVLDQGGGIFRLSPRSEHAREWLTANADGKRDGTAIVVTRKQAVRLIGAMRGAGLRVAGVF